MLDVFKDTSPSQRFSPTTFFLLRRKGSLVMSRRDAETATARFCLAKAIRQLSLGRHQCPAQKRTSFLIRPLATHPPRPINHQQSETPPQLPQNRRLLKLARAATHLPILHLPYKQI